ncbi:VOC family protein [Burkholderia multivorans]|uniref:VOC family protein n=1 Tax=Burkholderia multivorans TaxID=87883 RepID=UPI002019EC37|nr:VOC family protein [Burkholderia multivorans]MCL4661357.1 VOC family protein [Burkholderia multivorans]MCO1352787.1 VOC family protein [Burkholderia multivorans]MCO1413366.1 VOC family protein [Burkholderia multivorans]MCO1446443.1 VOC family protein [Burkholderia multivorans]UQP46856.1 VOC family protein [Burkholderia multivorans]
MSEISSLGYVVLNVSDLDAWEHFATNIIGLMVGRRDDRSLALRMDEYAQRILLEKGTADDISAAGWQFDTARELEQYVARIRSLDVEVVEGDAQTAKGRRVEKLFSCDDPNGFRHEFFFGPSYAPISSPFRSPVMKGSGFVTGRQGIGHILPIAQNYEETVDFYTRKLGFLVSDYIRDSETLPGVDFDATFFHTRTGRHHSLATAYAPTSKHLNHMMLEVADLNDVGLAYDRCIKEGLPIYMGIGHHPNDHVISFYVQSPSGFAVEYGHGSIVIDDAAWEVKNYSQMSDWGHSRTLARSAR